MLQVLIGVCLVFILARLIYQFVMNKKYRDKKVAYIVVLGDIGRSPRMNYHCLSLVNLGYYVILIGYKENKQLEEIESNPNVHISPLKPFPKHLQAKLKVLPSIAQYGLKVLYLSLGLFFALVNQAHIPNFVLVQNPPSIPTLAIVYAYTRIVGTKFVIDWHNYGFTILALTNGPNNIIVKICRIMELFFGRKSDLNFCVTDAMKNDLKNYKINAITMHDKPHERFRELNTIERHEFYLRLIDKYNISTLSEENGNTIFTQTKNESVERKADRPAILVSSSSWTEDEDFHLLIEAFEIYEKSSPKRDILCFLTGKGPLKEYYENLFKEKAFKSIQVHFLWLDPSDYPLLLGSADLGVCFHKSSSNLDLPMKVVDMFGCRLPACAYEFTCIGELVKNDENGLLFKTGQTLATHLLNLLPTMNEEESRLSFYRKNLVSFSNWNKEWDSKVKPAICLY